MCRIAKYIHEKKKEKKKRYNNGLGSSMWASLISSLKKNII